MRGARNTTYPNNFFGSEDGVQKIAPKDQARQKKHQKFHEKNSTHAKNKISDINIISEMVNDTLPSPTKVLNAFHKQRQQINQAQLTKPSALLTKMSSPPPAKKARKSKSTPAAAATGGKPIDDLTALTTAQLYALSSRRHRDQSREAARLAQEERDRAHIALEQSQKLLERGEFFLHHVFVL